MNKVDFLSYWFNNDGYIEKAAIQSVVTIQLEDPSSSEMFKAEADTQLKEFGKATGVWVKDGKFFSYVNGEETHIQGDVSEPLFYMTEKVTVPAGFHPMVTEAMTTTFGLLLFNIVIFYESVGLLQPYVNKEFTKGLIENFYIERMVDDPPEGEDIPQGKASCTQCLELLDNIYYLQGLGQYFIKPGGLDALTVDPSIIKRKYELFEKHKDELNDPVVFNAIVDELVEMDRKIQLSGPSKNFYINDKFISNARKRMFIAFGIEPNQAEGGWVSITSSLDEGTDTKLLNHYINTSIEGSYGRGKATGEGGARVKETIRLFSRIRVNENIDDCGSTVTEPIELRKEVINSWIGGNFLEGKKVVQLTKENKDSYLNKTVNMRVPQYCRAELDEKETYCKVCLGKKLGSVVEQLSSELTLIPTGFMLQRMKGMHIAGTSNVTLDLDLCLKG